MIRRCIWLPLFATAAVFALPVLAAEPTHDAAVVHVEGTFCGSTFGDGCRDQVWYILPRKRLPFIAGRTEDMARQLSAQPNVVRRAGIVLQFCFSSKVA